MNYGVVSHVGFKATDKKRKFHIVELGNDKYKLQIRKFGQWVYVRKNFKPRIFEDFSSIVHEIQLRKKVTS